MRETSHAMVGTRRCETAERTTDPSTASRKNELDIHQLPCETRRSLPHPETLFHLIEIESQLPDEYTYPGDPPLGDRPRGRKTNRY